MPIYEYQCKNCGRTLEKRQKFSDEPLTVCPYCEGTLEKLISAPAVQFKGGGWYADGYGNKSSAKSTSSDSSSSGSSSDSSSSSTASAPAAPASAPASSTPAASTPSSSGTAK